MNLLDPYKLLGVTIDTELVDVKKQYYHLALLCHPDKGGSEKDMIVVHKAYKYIENQLKDIKKTTYEDLEKEFNDFCTEQVESKLPTFYSIYHECHDWLDKFNKEFDKNINLENNYNLYSSKGYGNLMEKEKIDTDTYKCYEQGNLTNQFENKVIEYKEPISYQDLNQNTYRVDKKEITDFSDNSLGLTMHDYFQAFCKPEKLESKENLDFDILKRYNQELNNRNL